MKNNAKLNVDRIDFVVVNCITIRSHLIAMHDILIYLTTQKSKRKRNFYCFFISFLFAVLGRSQITEKKLCKIREKKLKKKFIAD